jgi:hypothetical protein
MVVEIPHNNIHNSFSLSPQLHFLSLAFIPFGVQGISINVKENIQGHFQGNVDFSLLAYALASSYYYTAMWQEGENKKK